MDLTNQQKSKKSGKFLLIYLGGAWVIVEAFSFIIDRYDLDQGLIELLIIVLVSALPSLFLFSWASRSITKWTIPVYILNIGIILYVLRFFMMNPLAFNPEKLRIVRFTNSDSNSPKVVESNSIAILPFSNYTGDPDQEYLIAGMHDGMISEVGSIGTIRVISRTSTLVAASSNQSITGIANQLNVSSILESSLSRFGDQIIVRLKLFNTQPSEEMIWSKEFETSFAEIPSLYKEITASVVLGLNENLSPEQQQKLTQKVRYNPDAYEAVLKGLYYSGFLTPDGFDKAEEQFQKAIELDSLLAVRAYSGLVIIWLSKRQMGYVPSLEGAAKAEEYFSRQISLDSTFRHAEGALMTWARYDFEKADAAFRYSIAQSPNDALGKATYAHYLMIVGRMDDAWEQMDKAIELDPLNPWVISFSGVMYAVEGKLITASKKFETLAQMIPDHPMALEHLLRKYNVFNEKHKAIHQIKQINNKIFGINMDDYIDRYYAQNGYKATLKAVADSLSNLYSLRYIDPYRIYQLYGILEDRENCIKWMEEMYRIRSGGIPYFAIKPSFYKFSDDPRYIQIMKKIGLW